MRITHTVETDDGSVCLDLADGSTIVALIARGCTDRDIARSLGIGFGTVRTHIANAMTKTGCANRAALAAAIARRP